MFVLGFKKWEFTRVSLVQRCSKLHALFNRLTVQPGKTDYNQKVHRAPNHEFIFLTCKNILFSTLRMTIFITSGHVTDFKVLIFTIPQWDRPAPPALAEGMLQYLSFKEFQLESSKRRAFSAIIPVLWNILPPRVSSATILLTLGPKEPSSAS